RRLVECLALQQPTMFVFEDVHWADQSQLDLLDYLASRIRDAQAVLLILARPELLDVRPSWGTGHLAHTTIPIEPLPPTAAASVVGKTFWRAMVRVVGELDEVDALLEALEARDFVRRVPSSQLEGDVEYTFKHILIRDVAYGTLPRTQRRERHASVARYLEEAV